MEGIKINWTEEEYTEYIKNHKKKRPPTDIPPEPLKKKSKYGNKKATRDGLKFDSEKEATYYDDLVLLLRAKEILGFCREPKFSVGGGRVYEPDFVVFYEDRTEIIDIKGDWKNAETDVFKIKRDLFNEKYPGLEIKIIK